MIRRALDDMVVHTVVAAIWLLNQVSDGGRETPHDRACA